MHQSDEKNSNLGYDKDLFVRRLDEAMHLAKMDYESLADKFCELGYSITGSNLRTYVTQRNLSLKVLVYLSKALNVSMDSLIGNEVGFSSYVNESFDHNIYGARYSQYPGEYTVYFFSTRTNEPEEIIEATLEIQKNFYSILRIPVSIGLPKEYVGHLLLSQKTNTAFLSMLGQHGEMIQFTFNDPNTIQNKMRFCVAGLISVSSGDAKRMPTLSRAIITEKAVTDEGMDFIDANLRLNSKYIDIQRSKLELTVTQFLEEEAVEDGTEICERLRHAFKAKEVLSIEEQYFLNTFKNENNLSNLQVEKLIAALRKNSMSNINIKSPRSIDARLYILLKENNMFKSHRVDS